MCGITGWIDYSLDLTHRQSIAQAMTDTMACRGPDADGVWLSEHAFLGHRRLAVIDIEGGTQPMITTLTPDRKLILVFSGEVYNYKELREELTAKGHRFTTASDTEVVLRAHIEWGTAALDRFNGMYAYALWDTATEELLLARDRMGVKPLYYYPTPDGVLFGSEPKAILAHPDVPRELDIDGLRELMDMLKTPGQAIYRGMKEVKPGHFVTVDKHGLTDHLYWAIESHPHEDSQQTTVSHVRELLEDIVSRQLNADVPLCSLLSGGLDSSAITAIAARQLASTGNGRINTFSVDFNNGGREFVPDPLRDKPDSPFVLDFIDHVAVEHANIELNSDELGLESTRDAVLDALDLPAMNYGDLWPSLYLLFKAVRAKSTVALSGESADELFGGYAWFHEHQAVYGGTFPWLTKTPGPFYDGTALFTEDFRELLDTENNRKIRYEEALAEVPRLAAESGHNARMREVSYLNLTRFLNTLLDRKDRMSMAVGLEVRVPFCDHRLVDYVFNIPWDMKNFDGREKSILRAATADLLPQSILQRVKAPYPSTQESNYEALLIRKLGALVAKPDEAPIFGFLDPERVARRIAEPASGVSSQITRIDLETVLWLNKWMKKYEIATLF